MLISKNVLHVDTRNINGKWTADILPRDLANITAWKTMFDPHNKNMIWLL